MKTCTTGIAVLVVMIVGVLPTFSVAQQKYTPEHPEVKAMADQAVAFIKGNRGTSQSPGYKAVSALAVVEHGKRYNGRAPKEDPFVKSACDQIMNDLGGIKAQNEVYYACVAIILLAETDAQAYKSGIKELLDYLVTRQEPNGSFTYQKDNFTSDTSQTQFVALAMFVGKHHGFDVDVDMAKRALDWIVASQQPGGVWVYKLQASASPQNPGTPKGTTKTISMQAAGAGTAYLLADFLQLNKRAKQMSAALAKKDIGLPKTVSVYVKPLEGETSMLKKAGPLVSYDRAKLGNAYRSGNQRLEEVFRVDPSRWPTYYLYALERYAYFREQAEGNVGNGKIATWYDQAVEHLKSITETTGGFKGTPGEPTELATAFGVLVLVRSSEVITSPVKTTRMIGGRGFQADAVLREGRNGRIDSVNAEQDLGALIEMMKSGATPQQLQQLSESLKKQIVEFRQKDDKSRGEIKAFLQSMVSARDYFRRLIAVRFLAGEQDMDNVPALLYALGDPDLRICLEAHDGLRLVSRKIDSMSVAKSTRENAPRDPGVLTAEEENLCRMDFDSMKKKWTEWYLNIRPGAELLD